MNRTFTAKKRTAKKLEKLFFRLILGISAAILLLFAAAIHSRSQERNNIRIQESCYRSMEKDYIEQVRDLLREEGYPDSGITLTKIFVSGEEHDYTVTIHHKLIGRMDEAGRAELEKKILQIIFPAPNCAFSCEFLLP